MDIIFNASKDCKQEWGFCDTFQISVPRYRDGQDFNFVGSSMNFEWFGVQWSCLVLLDDLCVIWSFSCVHVFCTPMVMVKFLA